MKEVNRPEKAKKEGKPENLPYNPEVTDEDKEALNKKGRSMNKGQDKTLDRERPVDFTEKDMDIPTSNANRSSKPGEIPDEENRQFNHHGERNKREESEDHPNSSKKI